MKSLPEFHHLPKGFRVNAKTRKQLARRKGRIERRLGGRVVSLSDSEGDIYECFAAWLDDAEGPTADFIVRACQNRRVVPAEEEPDAATLLWDAVERSAVRGRRTIEVSMRPALTGDGSKRR
jgi:hypothetical protein